MLVIDGYNLLHVLVDAGQLRQHAPDGAGHGLARYLHQLGVARGDAGVVLVLDGTAGGAPPWGRCDAGPPGRDELRVSPVGPGKDADTFIEALLAYEEQRGRARRITVVSSDGRLREAARGVRARWMSSQDFARMLADRLARLERDPRRPPDHPTDRPDTRPRPAAQPASLPSLPDDWVSAAMEEWRGRINPDDLDMQRWIDPPQR